MDEELEEKSRAEESIDYEKLSYDPYTYRRVQHIRKKGLQHGVTVPKLNFELTKPERPRIPLLLMGVVSSVVFALVLILAVALYVFAVKNLGAFNIGDMFTHLFNPTVIVGTLGLSFLGALGVLLFYVVILIITAIPIIIIYYMYRFVRSMFALSRASKEEFAKGHRVTKYIVIFGAIGISGIVLMVILLISNWTAKSKIILSVMLILLAGLMIAYAIILLVEKVKTQQWFNDLDGERKDNYLAHDRALVRSKSRAERHGRIDTGFWR